MSRFVVAVGLALSLVACQGVDESYRSTRDRTPIPPTTLSLMAEKGVSASDPILMRSYKKESEVEIWKRKPDGQYTLLKTYPMCRWSGQLGPKIREGDRQAPEGFYDVTPGAMNPNSSLFLSFNLGYPNAYDRSHGRTGSHLMVHGTCSSRGCFAMTDEAIAEVYAVAREAFAGGQRTFQFQSYPFRMTAENLAKHRSDPHIAFWKNLKEGSDRFEVAKREPVWTVVGGRYAFNEADRATIAAVAIKQARDEREVAELVSKGTPSIRLVYEDGGGHQSFREVAMAAASASTYTALDDRTRRSIGDVSRPDALARDPEVISIGEMAPGKPNPTTRSTAVAVAAPARPGTTMEQSSSMPVVISTPAAVAKPVKTHIASLEAASLPAGPPLQVAEPAAKPIYKRLLGGLLGL
ncbi:MULTISPECIES: murein L,D-transpeptidase family protein [Bosea]|uniref:L,D-transpeptidase family protein n=1 Tax=Bosea vestrisii TaxID=151416 RepID=A0ABW0HBP9_9HYPH|nr:MULTISPECIES: murein L,D-transpeptidase family protein [Bosea]MCT4475384.1 murein L,D-transpeptidase [Bosea spartocytisi]